MALSRREFIQIAAAIGASLAWGGRARASRVQWRENERSLPPRRRVRRSRRQQRHPVDPAPVREAAAPSPDGRGGARTRISAGSSRTRRRRFRPSSDWTTRVLVGGLKPARVYWYRFTDADGNGSRIGRTITAPLDERSAPGQLRLRQLPERQRGQAQRLPADDLRGRARATRRTSSASCFTSAISFTRSSNIPTK